MKQIRNLFFVILGIVCLGLYSNIDSQVVITCAGPGSIDGRCFDCTMDPFPSTNCGCTWTGYTIHECAFDGLGSCCGGGQQN